NVIVSTRHYGEQGFPLYPGMIGHPERPEGGAAADADDADANARALVVLGDSFSVGYGLREEDVWPARLIAAGAAAGPRVRVFACGGYSPAEALRAWRRYGDPAAVAGGRVIVQL